MDGPNGEMTVTHNSNAPLIELLVVGEDDSITAHVCNEKDPTSCIVPLNPSTIHGNLIVVLNDDEKYVTNSRMINFEGEKL